MSDTPRTDALQEQLASADGPEGLYTEEMVDRIWMLLRDIEGQLTNLYANATGDSMALGIMQLQRDEIRTFKADLAALKVHAEAMRDELKAITAEMSSMSNSQVISPTQQSYDAWKEGQR